MNKTEHNDCCCTCAFQLKLNKHPGNNIHKGSILEHTGLYACTSLGFHDKENTAVVYEKEHGECEMYYRRTNERDS